MIKPTDAEIALLTATIEQDFAREALKKAKLRYEITRTATDSAMRKVKMERKKS